MEDVKEVKRQDEIDIDLTSFYMRRMLGFRLRNENIGKIPVLLYWHPNIDECASICGIPVPNYQTPQSTTLFQKIKQSFATKSATNMTSDHDKAIFKVLTPSLQTLEYIFVNTRQKILDSANEVTQRQYGKEFSTVWDERERLLVEKCPTWDAHDRQMVMGFYVVRDATPLAINASWRTDRIDMQYVGDDGLLRLFISIEFRRAYRDKLMQQQREMNIMMEKKARDVQFETKRLEQQESEKKTVEPTMDVEGKWEWEETNETQSSSNFLQRAGSNVVSAGSSLISGTFATTQAIVYGTGRIVTNVVGGGAEKILDKQ